MRFPAGTGTVVAVSWMSCDIEDQTVLYKPMRLFYDDDLLCVFRQLKQLKSFQNVSSVCKTWKRVVGPMIYSFKVESLVSYIPKISNIIYSAHKWIPIYDGICTEYKRETKGCLAFNHSNILVSEIHIVDSKMVVPTTSTITPMTNSVVKDLKENYELFKDLKVTYLKTNQNFANQDLKINIEYSNEFVTLQMIGYSPLYCFKVGVNETKKIAVTNHVNWTNCNVFVN